MVFGAILGAVTKPLIETGLNALGSLLGGGGKEQEVRQQQQVPNTFQISQQDKAQAFQGLTPEQMEKLRNEMLDFGFMQSPGAGFDSNTIA